MEVTEQCEGRSFKTQEERSGNEDTMDQQLKALVDKIAKKEGFITYEIKAEKILGDGNNFLGILSGVTIRDTSSGKNLDLFVKSIMPNTEESKILSVTDAYCKEIFLYLELSKLFEKFQDESQVPLEERYTFVKTYSESNTQHIIMENMVKKNYGIWNRFEVISLDFAEKAIKLLAKFHALGFVLKEKKPDYYNRKITPLKYPVVSSEEFHKFYENMCENVLFYLDGSAKNKFEKAFKKLYRKSREYIEDRQSTLTMCHGDYRPNNILIERIEDQITNMVPVDYQLLNHGTPINDLMFFIFGATDQEFRRKHLVHLKKLYHDTLKQFLEYFDMDVEKYFPKEEYERLYKERLDLGLFIGVWYLQFNLAQKEDIVDLTEIPASEIRYGRNELAKIRIQELVDDFIEWGYL